MKFTLFIATCLLATSMLVVGQQQPQNTTQTCAPVTSKPTTTVQKFVFKTCIVAQLSAYISLDHGQYLNLNNGTVNNTASRCDNATVVDGHIVEPQLVVDFPCATLSFSISHTNDSRTFVKAISGQYKLNTTSTTFLNETANFFTTQSGHYYKCNAEQAVPLGNNASLVLSNFAYEAYRDASGTDFYQIVEDCPLDSQSVSDLVRIGVGICLIALVAIVLIAYFIGRRRWSERSSYESV